MDISQVVEEGPFRSVHGVCACSRNTYIVTIPEPRIHEARVQFDTSSTNRRHQAAPFSAFLRVPLDWFHSATTAFFPDETHATIRRTYDAPEAPEHTRRQFCGYCGTPLSVWSERTRDEARFINVTLESLVDGEIGVLEELGLLAGDGEGEEQEEDSGEGTMQAPSGTEPVMTSGGSSWFEEMVDDGRLGRIKRQRGAHSSADGRVSVEWEVVEFTSEGDTGRSTPSKRKHGQLGGDIEA